MDEKIKLSDSIYITTTQAVQNKLVWIHQNDDHIAMELSTVKKLIPLLQRQLDTGTFEKKVKPPKRTRLEAWWERKNVPFFLEQCILEPDQYPNQTAFLFDQFLTDYPRCDVVVQRWFNFGAIEWRVESVQMASSWAITELQAKMLFLTKNFHNKQG